MTYQGLRPRQQTPTLDFLADNRNLNPTTTTEHQRMWHTDPTDAVFVGGRTYTRHTAVLYPENKHIISIWVLRRALEYDMMISPVLYIIKHRRAAATPVGRGGRFL